MSGAAVTLFSALLGLWLVAGSVAEGAAQSRRTNVVLFLADDLGYGDLGCYGHPRIRTPNLDAFAAQGVRLTQCYAASAVCSPSRSALLTGRTPHRNGVYTWIAAGSEVHLRAEERTVPKVLKEHGYATAHFGKWHLNGRFNSPAQPQPDDHGYDWWLATQNNAAPNHRNPTNLVRNGQRVGPAEGYSALIVAGEASEWLRGRRDADKPFFLTVWTHEPHAIIETDERFRAEYKDLPDPDLRQHHGNVAQLDAAFGVIVKTLDELKLADDTLVVFTSDNGPEGDGTKGRNRGSTGGLRGRKRDVYEGGIRVPCVVRWPGKIKPGTTCDAPVIGSDFFPTALAAAGVDVPPDRTLDGVSVLPLLTGEAKSVDRPVPMYWRLDMAPGGIHVAMRDGDWKILAPRDLSRFELYDLPADPRETTDLSRKEPRRLEEMKAKLTALHQKIEAEGPDWWKRLSADGARPPAESK